MQMITATLRGGRKGEINEEGKKDRQKEAKDTPNVSILTTYDYTVGAGGGVMVKALRYKLAGRGFDSRWCHWNFSVT
jgi:hypothetical protein